MRFDGLALFFPLVLAIHNAEELARYAAFAQAYRDLFRKEAPPETILRRAAWLLTLATALAAASLHISEDTRLRTAVAVAILALLFNAFGHLAASLSLLRIVPGTLSALLLILPFGGLAVAAMRLDLHMAWPSLLLDALLGAIANPIGIAVALAVSRRSSWPAGRRRWRRAPLP